MGPKGGSSETSNDLREVAVAIVSWHNNVNEVEGRPVRDSKYPCSGRLHGLESIVVGGGGSNNVASWLRADVVDDGGRTEDEEEEVERERGRRRRNKAGSNILN